MGAVYSSQGVIQMRKLSLLIAVIIVVAILAFGALGVGSARAADGSYVVQPGDTLFNIAARFNVSVSELATINKIYDINVLYVGQVLILPNPLSVPTTQSPIVINSVYGGVYAPAGPTYSPVYTAPIFTPPVVTYPAGTSVTTTTTYSSYVVQPGDFLASIANRFNTTPGAILSANAIPDPNLLYVGQLLTIPNVKTNVVQPTVHPAMGITTMAGGRIYIVQPGDNLFSIAARFGRNAYAIAQANGLLNLNAVYIGEPLIIP